MATGGLVGDVRGIAAVGLRMARTRLELLAIEVQQEKARVARQLIVVSATLFFASFGLMLTIAWLALSLPEAQRANVLGGLGLAFLAAAAAGAMWLKAAPRERPLSASLAALRADERALASPAAGDD
jgi:uncharacterized membrane protein YqjE